jgi:hypothetical protein|tara:strand:+ start:50 stop:463 length:414 start_codon:yes stop_codon:yes gene_type:complete
MAYVSKEDKARLAPGIKAVLNEYGMKGSIAVRHGSTLVVNVKSGPIDIIGNANIVRKKNCEQKGYDFFEIDGHLDVNVYHIYSNHSGKAADFLKKLLDAMMGDEYYCEDDIQTDYFHRSHYTNINIGGWSKPYELAA